MCASIQFPFSAENPQTSFWPAKPFNNPTIVPPVPIGVQRISKGRLIS